MPICLCAWCVPGVCLVCALCVCVPGVCLVCASCVCVPGVCLVCAWCVPDVSVCPRNLLCALCVCACRWVIGCLVDCVSAIQLRPEFTVAFTDGLANYKRKNYAAVVERLYSRSHPLATERPHLFSNSLLFWSLAALTHWLGGVWAFENQWVVTSFFF